MIWENFGMLLREREFHSPADDAFRAKHPNVPGRLVLQDLPNVLDGIQQLDQKIERMEYDFYTEQPVKGTVFRREAWT